MVVTGFQGGQPSQAQPFGMNASTFAVNASFLGWFCLLFALVCSGLALDAWEGEVMAQAARLLLHAVLFGTSLIAFARYLSFSRRRPLENLLGDLERLQSTQKSQSTTQGNPQAGPNLLALPWGNGAFKAARFYGLLIVSLAALVASVMPVAHRLIALAWLDALWFCLALDALMSQFRFRRLRAKERVKDALDDMRSKKAPAQPPALHLKPDVPWWSNLLMLLGLAGILVVSHLRLDREEIHVMQAELRHCLSTVAEDIHFRGEVKLPSEGCSQGLLTRFKVLAVGVGESRKVMAKEKAGIDPLADGLPGNQAWTLQAKGLITRER